MDDAEITVADLKSFVNYTDEQRNKQLLKGPAEQGHFYTPLSPGQIPCLQHS